METTSPQVATVSSYRHSTQHACVGGAPHVPSSHVAGMFWLRLRQPPKRHVRGANIPQQPMERDPLVRASEDVCERTRRAGGLGMDPSRGRGGRCMQVSEDVCEAGVARRRASNECEPQVESGGAHLSEDVFETCIACGRSADGYGRLTLSSLPKHALPPVLYCLAPLAPKTGRWAVWPFWARNGTTEKLRSPAL